MMLHLLASYPKSGNTWMRAILSNYFWQEEGPANINQLMGSPILSLRSRLDEEVGIDSSTMSDKEVDCWRPAFCRSFAQQLNDPTFVKVHDARFNNTRGEPLFPADAVTSVVYLVRNPMEVCISYAHHQNKPIDWTIDWMENDSAAMYAQGEFYQQLPQRISSWSGNVRSWIEQDDIPVHIMRYEDLLVDAQGQLRNMFSTLNIPVDDGRLKTAIENASFSELKAQEKRFGFAEKNPKAKSFFRKGSLDNWRSILSNKQVDRIFSAHGSMMETLGYKEV